MKALVDKFRHSDLDIMLLRISVIFIIALFGNYKWFEFEVEALKPLISGTWLSFLYDIFGFHGASYLLGIVESIGYISLIAGFFKPKAGIIGDLITIAIGVTTLSLIPQYGLEGFIVKDAVLLGAGVVLLKYDLNATINCQKPEE